MHSREATFIEAQIDKPNEHRGPPRHPRGGRSRHRQIDRPLDPAIESFSRQLAERFSDDVRRVRGPVQDESQVHAGPSGNQQSFSERTNPRRAYLLLLALCLGTGLLAAGALYFLRPHVQTPPAPIAQPVSPTPSQATLVPSSTIPVPVPTPAPPPALLPVPDASQPLAPAPIVDAAPVPVVPVEERAVVVDTTPRDPMLNPAEAKELQTLLTTRGLTPGPVDGIIGPMTAAAVRRYEEREGLRPTGLVNYPILQHLRTKQTSSTGPEAAASQ
jgi:hypothetical protein